MSEGQLAFDLRHRPAFSARSFIPAPCNADALAWIALWPNWQGFALALTGPEGSGKTHLAHVLAARAGGRVIEAAALHPRDPPDLATHMLAVVEDADRGVDEAALFHLHNLMGESGGYLLLTGREPPARWRIALPDLRSRLAALPVATLQAPDDDLLAGVLLKLFADRGIEVEDDVVTTLVRRMDRSFAAAQRVVAELDRAALATGRPVTAPLAREIVAALQTPPDEDR